MSGAVKPVTLHMMRHGAPEQPGRLLGHIDMASTAAGIAQCVERARGLDFAAMTSSDLSRARLPAGMIAAERAIPHNIDPRWRELHFGQWEGADPVTLPAQELARFWNDPDAFPPPDGERWSGLCARIEAALRSLSEPVLILSHAGAMRAAIAVLCGLDARQCWAVDLPYGAVLSLKMWPGENLSGQITGLSA